jgi:hypothetical protein
MTTTREQRTLDWYTGRFEREYEDARSEYQRLEELFKDVCWYNFERTCLTWRYPWRQSYSDSKVELLGMSFTRKWNRGCLIEHGHFPTYYSGPLDNAPDLPPQILLDELKAARDYMEACKKQTTAPYDWAPGGELYKELVRTTLVGPQCVYAKRRKFSSC